MNQATLFNRGFSFDAVQRIKKHATGQSRLRALQATNDQRGREMDEARPMFERMRHRHENGTAPRAVTAWQLFQTPPEIARKLAELLPAFSHSDAPRILEPSAGLGRLLDAALARCQTAQITAIETDGNLCGELFRYQVEGVRVIEHDFLELEPEQIGHDFDAVLMNPPFHMRADIKHIRHALRFLKPGGTLAALCMNTRHRIEALQDMADTWQELPAGTFRQEGTNIETVLLSITK